MNQYGFAPEHWKRWRPASYAAITDPGICQVLAANVLVIRVFAGRGR